MPVDLSRCDSECGCAAKMPAHHLRRILHDLDLPSSPSLIVGPDTLDDAGIYKVSEDICLVQTVDYFPPVARDPYVYGQIAAANALSDVYAMGGEPLTALAIVCFPVSTLEPEVLKGIIRGAADKLREAGTVLAGGHSIVDAQPKFGLAVTGLVHPEGIMDNAHARPGDVLILTKPLGTGITIMAAKARMASQEQEDEANRCMSTLNAEASRIARKHAATSCTDVTGFGLLGHAYQMAEASEVSMEIWMEDVPRPDGVLSFAAMALLSGAAYANREYAASATEFADDIELAEQDLLFDPQTSGGLLIACPEDEAQQLIYDAKKALPTPCAVVGTLTERQAETRMLVRRRSAKGE